MNKSNLFYYATSELSQDAFLCWLADCANYKSEDDLQDIAKEFIKMLIDKYANFKNIEIQIDDIKKVEVIRQEKNIDIILKVNEKYIIVIEDKTNTSEHSNQLERYKNYIEDYYNDDDTNEENIEQEEKDKFQLIYIYLKTGNYSLHSSPKTDYAVVNRENLLEVLSDYKGSNNILLDFKEHMQNASDYANIFKNEPVSKWNNHAWQGFYTFIQNEVRQSGYNWIYVPIGDFYGLFGHIIVLNDKSLYLQFEQKHLAIKVGVPNKDERTSFRNKAHDILIKFNNDELKLKRPERFGWGHYMTIAIVSNEDFFADNKITANFICKQLKQYEDLIDVVAEKL